MRIFHISKFIFFHRAHFPYFKITLPFGVHTLQILSNCLCVSVPMVDFLLDLLKGMWWYFQNLVVLVRFEGIKIIC